LCFSRLSHFLILGFSWRRNLKW